MGKKSSGTKDLRIVLLRPIAFCIRGLPVGSGGKDNPDMDIDWLMKIQFGGWLGN